MSGFTMRLIKCPACGGPIDPPGGASSTACPYCGTSIAIPENMRKPDPNQKQEQGSLFNGIDSKSLSGYGQQWAEVTQLAQSGRKEEAITKYMSFANVSEASARYTVEALSGAQTYEYAPTTTGFSVTQLNTPAMISSAKMIDSYTGWMKWLGCGITAFVLIIIALTVLPILIGVAASLWAAFN